MNEFYLIDSEKDESEEIEVLAVLRNWSYLPRVGEFITLETSCYRVTKVCYATNGTPYLSVSDQINELRDC